MTYWEPVFKKVGKKKAEILKTRIKNLCWWEEVASKVTGFPATPNVYHWHPVAFVENMREMNKKRAPWMIFVLNETKKANGTDESKEPLYSMVIRYHNHVGIIDNINTEEKKEDDPTAVAWCASFVSWCLDQASYTSPKTSGSRFYIADDIKWNAKSKDLLKKVTDPVYGAIAAFSDCDSTGNCKLQGHVGFLYGKLSNGQMAILGGNQGNKLKLTGYDCSGKVFVSYTDETGNKHYKKFRGFYLPKLFDYSEYDILSKSDIISTLSEENARLTGTEIKVNSKGESSR